MIATGAVASVASLAAGATYQWTGGASSASPVSGNWNVGGNWVGGVVPVSASSTSLSFGGGTTALAYTANNDMPTVPFVLSSLSLNSNPTTGVSQLTGSQLRFVGGQQVSNVANLNLTAGKFIVANDIELGATLQYGNIDGGGTATLSGAITGTGALRISRNGPLTLTGVNSYAGTTDIQFASLNVLGSGTTGTGDVLVKLGTALVADSSANLKSNNQIKLSSGGFVQFNTLDTAAVQRVDPTSTGVVGLGADSALAVDFTGRPNVSLGVRIAGAGSTIMSGAITPANNTFRFGGAYNPNSNNSGLTKVLEIASLLADSGPSARSVRIVTNGALGSGDIKLSNPSNSYTGGTTVESGAILRFDTTPTPAQTPLGAGPVNVAGAVYLVGQNGGMGSLPNTFNFQPNSTLYFHNSGAMTSSDHWADSRAMHIDGYTLQALGNNSTALNEHLGTLSISGNARIIQQYGSAGVTNGLEFASISRQNRGTLKVQSVQSNAFGVENQLKFTDTAGLSLGPNGLVPGWVVGNLSGAGNDKDGDFLRVDSNGVLQKAAYIPGFDPDAITEMTFTSGAYAGTAWGVRMQGFSAGASGTLTIRGGGLIMNAMSFNNDGIYFENHGTPVEGAIYCRGNFNSLGGAGIVSADGITKFGNGTLWLMSASSFSGPITINEGNLVASGIGSLNYNNPNPLFVNQGAQIDLYGNEHPVKSLAGSGTVISSTGGLTGQRFLVIQGGEGKTFSGTIKDVSGTSLIGLLKDGAGTQTLSGTLAWHGPTITWGGKLLIAAPLTTSAWISAQNDSTLAIAPGSGAVIKTGGVSIFSTGKIDLADAKLISVGGDIGSLNGSTYTGLTGLIQAGRNGGTWDASGVTTSMPDAQTGYTSLAIATAAQIGRTGLPFGGITVSATDVLVMYTYGGDANLSGNVDVDDYGQIDFNASTGGALSGWFNGDFDYNGVQDVDDYGVIDFVVGVQGPPFLSAADSGFSIASVPEPTVSGLAIGAVVLTRRRRSEGLHVETRVTRR